MALSPFHPLPRDDDLDASCARIRGKILDGIETMLDELAQPDAQRATIAQAVHSHVAPLYCHQALCRRAQRCRRQPCAVTETCEGA